MIYTVESYGDGIREQDSTTTKTVETYTTFTNYNQIFTICLCCILATGIYGYIKKESQCLIEKVYICTCIKQDFNGERLSIVGDCNLILKDEHLLHSMGLIDEKYWKKYE